MLKVGDQVKVYDLFPTLRTVGSSSAVEATIFSSPMPLTMGNEYAVIVNAEHVSTVGPRDIVAMELLAGTTTYASPTAYTSIGGCTVMASGATQTKVNYARICIRGTATKVVGGKLTLDGATITYSNTADSSILVHTTDCSNAAAKLATCIQTLCPNLDATWYSAGVTTGPAYVDIRPKNGDYVFDITATGIQEAASVDSAGMLCSRSAMYEFKADEVATKSTLGYNRFAVRLNTTGTVARLNAQVIVADSRYRPNIKIARAQLGTVSTAYSS